MLSNANHKPDKNRVFSKILGICISKTGHEFLSGTGDKNSFSSPNLSNKAFFLFAKNNAGSLIFDYETAETRNLCIGWADVHIF